MLAEPCRFASLKPFTASQWVQLPPGKGAAHQPEARDACRAVTHGVKRTQRAAKLRYRASRSSMSVPSAFRDWGPHRKRRHGRGALGRPGSAHEGTPARAGKMAKRTACRVVSRHGLRFARTSSKYGKALSAKWLAIRAGRPRVRRRTAGGAGAPRRKRPSLAQKGLSERSPPRFFLAGRPNGSGRSPRLRPRAPKRHAPLTECAVRFEVR